MGSLSMHSWWALFSSFWRGGWRVIFYCSQCVPNVYSSCSQRVLKFPNAFPLMFPMAVTDKTGEKQFLKKNPCKSIYTQMAYPGLRIEGHPCHSSWGTLKKCVLPFGRLVWTLAVELKVINKNCPSSHFYMNLNYMWTIKFDMYKVLFSPFMKLNLTFYSLMYKIHSSQWKTFTMNCLYKTLKKWQGLSDAIRS
jgi:hypothetical protein